MEQSFAKHPVHQGQNIQKFRIIRNMSQTDVASDLELKRGKPVSQQFVSDIEQKETIEDDELLKQIAEYLSRPFVFLYRNCNRFYRNEKCVL